ncbi:MAG: twin-arginine translocase subunit TatC [Planctomycetaceae bacterium]|nr:twin-arginine translocase subunit TatC [Planctomycetaceae bacterium]
MAKRPQDDLFESTTMSFGEHLEELRGCLVRALLGLLIGFVIGLAVANRVVKLIQAPLTAALESYYLDKEKTSLEEGNSLTHAEDLGVLNKDKLIQDRVKIDPVAILEYLKAADPTTFENLRVSRYQFRRSDVREAKWQPLSAHLNNPNKATHPAAWKIWTLLDVQQQQTLKELQAEKTEFTADQQHALVEILNGLLAKPDLNRAEEFSKLTGGPAPDTRFWDFLTGADDVDVDALRAQTVRDLRAIADDGALSEEQSRKLNQLLLTRVLVEFLRSPEPKLIPLQIWRETEVRVQALGVHEAFMIWLKAGFVSGLVIASPWIFWQLWLFVAAGLYPHEKRYVHVFLPISLGLFLAGVSLAFVFVFEPVLAFLFSFNKYMGIDPDPRISEWLSFVLFLPLGFGVAFQLPLVMLFINRIGLVSEAMFLEKWRIAILVIFVISMLLTPADPISMLLMALPLTLLYFFGVGLCRWMPHFRNRLPEGYDP